MRLISISLLLLTSCGVEVKVQGTVEHKLDLSELKEVFRTTCQKKLGTNDPALVDDCINKEIAAYLNKQT